MSTFGLDLLCYLWNKFPKTQKVLDCASRSMMQSGLPLGADWPRQNKDIFMYVLHSEEHTFQISKLLLKMTGSNLSHLSALIFPYIQISSCSSYSLGHLNLTSCLWILLISIKILDSTFLLSILLPAVPGLPLQFIVPPWGSSHL